LERDYFEELGVDERRVLAVELGGKERIAVTQDRETSRTVVNAVMKFFTLSNFGTYCLAEKLLASR
jgi:hypothetical protein